MTIACTMEHTEKTDVGTLTNDERIDLEFQELLDIYLASKHRKKVNIITQAFHFAREAHRDVNRASGEPYILHPLAVAKIVSKDIGLGSTSICAALLHDVVEDTDYTIADIENLFGSKIAQIVEGLTKIAGGIFGDKASVQAENFKKLLLTMNEDIRVVIIKMADRLHNMRTLQSLPPSKQYKIAGETLYIYAPLANRLGLNAIKTELEDLSFQYEHPMEYAQIVSKLKETQLERDTLFEEFTDPIKELLQKMGLEYQINARVKTPYSIWRKMQNKHVPFEEIFDILAVRIIFMPHSQEEEVNDCFNIYVNIAKIYKPHPDRLRDWISHPKANGYRALHVTLMSNRGQWVEVQIRSDKMNDIAEKGFAAHWKYKEGQGEDSELDKWLRTIKEILDDPQPDSIDFLDTIKMNLFASEIMVFTPKGDIKSMPQNSTVLDFAFSIHTFLGSHCIGAKVNHKLVPISHKLKSGDQVEILTSQSQRVQESWINFVTTAKAKSKIQVVLKREWRNNIQEGEATLRKFVHDEGISLENNGIQRLCILHGFRAPNELYAAIGKNEILLDDNTRNELVGKSGTNWKRIMTFGLAGKKDKSKKQKDLQAQNPDAAKPSMSSSQVVRLTSDTYKKNYTLAECCNPIPGDDIVGFLDEENRIVVHKRECPVATRLQSSFGNKLVNVQWEAGHDLYFPVTILVHGFDATGVLNRITGVISQQMNVNIRKLNIEAKDGLFEGRIQLNVHNVDDVKTVLSNLQGLKELQKITRVDDYEV